MNRRKFLVRGSLLASYGTTQLLLTACGGGGGGGGGDSSSAAEATTGLAPAQTSNEYGAGLIPQTKEQQKALPIVYGAEMGTGETPAAYDLAALGFLPPVGNQGRSQSCTAWAFGYATATFMYTKKYRLSPADASNQVSASHLWAETAAVKGSQCDVGATMALVKELLKKEPIGFESDFPSTGLTYACPARGAERRGILLTGAEQLFGPGSITVQSIKSHIAHHEHPMPVGMLLPTEPFFAYKGGVFNQVAQSNAPYFGHAMCIVGYDDAINAFKIMNSYGPQWGDRGFFWINYDAFLRSGLVRDTVPEVFWTTDVELSGETPPQTGSGLRMVGLQATHQVQANNSDVLFLSYSLNDWMQVTHVAYSFTDAQNVTTSTNYIPYSIYAKDGYIYFALPAGQRYQAGIYTLWLYGRDRAGGQVQLNGRARLI